MFRKINLIIIFVLMFLLTPIYGDSAIAMSEDVSLDKVWTIRFNNSIDGNSVNEDTIYIEEYETKIKFPVKYKIDLEEVQLLHDIPFDENKRYVIRVVNVSDIDGNILKSPYEKDFKTKSKLDSKSIIIDLDDQEMREKYGVESEGTYFYPTSYDNIKKEWVAYVVRTLVDKKAIDSGSKGYEISDDVAFTRTLDIYTLLAPSENVMIGDNLDSSIKLKDLSLNNKVKMEFTKEKPYWIEKITWKRRPEQHTIIFSISEQDRNSQDNYLHKTQYIAESNYSGGYRRSLSYNSKEVFEFIDFEEILLKDMPEIMLFRDIYDYHGINYSQSDPLMDNPYASRRKDIIIKYIENEYVYYNILENHVDIESYMYNTLTRDIVSIPNVIIYSMDDTYIYSMEDFDDPWSNNRIIRMDRDGKNLIYIKIPFVDEIGANKYRYPKVYGEHIYAIQTTYTNSKIIRMKKDGTFPEMLVDQYSILSPFYGKGGGVGYEVNEHGVFFALEDGIYQYSHDGTRKQKIVSGDYITDYWKDGFLYYIREDSFLDYNLHKIKTNYLESKADNPDPEVIPVNNSNIYIKYEDGYYNIYSNVNFSGANHLYVDISNIPPEEYDLYTEEVFDMKFNVDGFHKDEKIASIGGLESGMHIYFRLFNEIFEGKPEYYGKVQYGGTGE